MSWNQRNILQNCDRLIWGQRNSLVTETCSLWGHELNLKKTAGIIDRKWLVSITDKDVSIAATFPVNGAYCARLCVAKIRINILVPVDAFFLYWEVFRNVTSGDNSRASIFCVRRTWCFGSWFALFFPGSNELFIQPRAVARDILDVLSVAYLRGLCDCRLGHASVLGSLMMIWWRIGCSADDVRAETVLTGFIRGLCVLHHKLPYYLATPQVVRPSCGCPLSQGQLHLSIPKNILFHYPFGPGIGHLCSSTSFI